MCVALSASSQQVHRFISGNLYQKGTNCPLILQLPLDILKLIGSLVAIESTETESAKNAIKFGRVCILTHLLMEKIIDQLKIDIAIDDLAKAIVERAVTYTEMGFPKFDRNIQVRLIEKAKLNILYKVFQEKAVKSNFKENSKEFVDLSIIFQERLRVRCLELDEMKVSICLKMSTALSAFTGKTIRGMIIEYINQPLDNITSEDLEEAALDMQAPFIDIMKLVHSSNEPFSIDDNTLIRSIRDKLHKAVLAKRETHAFALKSIGAWLLQKYSDLTERR